MGIDLQCKHYALKLSDLQKNERGKKKVKSE